MFTRIMTPVDLRHIENLEKALAATAALSKAWDVPVTFVSVTAPQPGEVAHSPEEFSDKLRAFAEEQATSRGIAAEAHTIVKPDPQSDLDGALMDAVEELKADLVVMASHRPGLAEYVWPSHGGKLAAHSKASVLVVRDD